MTTLTIDHQTNNSKADWLLVFEAALRVGNFSSFDGLIQLALDAWLAQLSPELRWRIAVELYSNDQVSTGRAAQIAGLNYIVFMERLRERGLPFMGAEPADGEEQEREKALLDELFSFTPA